MSEKEAEMDAGIMAKWKLYEDMIAGVPEGIGVRDFCVGENWCYVEAECGSGMSYRVAGTLRETFLGDPRSLDLRSLASLVKSWNFREASLGLAALNAWYSQVDKIEKMGAQIDYDHVGSAERTNPFMFMQDDFSGKKVTVIGHFPNVEHMNSKAELTVLERNCTSPLDTPDSACEYILPEQDYVLLTGTTLINKTAPRLFELSAQATVVMTGPSTVPCSALQEAGVNMLAGSVVVDPQAAQFAVKGASKDVWRSGVKKFIIQA